jgi:hypothetical protein
MTQLRAASIKTPQARLFWSAINSLFVHFPAMIACEIDGQLQTSNVELCKCEGIVSK